MGHQPPSLYEMLTGNFTGELDLRQVSEKDQLVLSVLNNIERILNCRAGTLAHLPDYGVTDMSTILNGLPSTAHELMEIISTTLLKYEPRLKTVHIDLLPDVAPSHLIYALDVELHDIGWVRYDTEFKPEGRVLIRHLKQQEQL